MKLIVIGREQEVAGFALAGVQTLTCNSADDAAAAVDRVTAPGGDTGLVLVSPWIARHASRVLNAAQQRKGPPVVTVMPG